MAITWLADQLRKDGYIPVLESTGWKSRTRPGSFVPVGVLFHHTGAFASRSNPAPSLHTVINGRSDLPGPLCHVLVGFDGSCRVIAAGRANHAGTARASGPIGPGDGNAKYVGIEIDYSGYQAPSKVQYANAVNVAAAILARLGKSSNHCRCHLETSTTGKWDPGSTWTPAEWRSMVNAWMKHRWGTASSTSRVTGAVGLDDLRDRILATGPADLAPEE